MKRFLLPLVFLFSLASVPANAQTTVNVFAASSLTAPYKDAGKLYEKTHSGIKINFIFSASSTLATQILNGASADIFVSASPVDMKRVKLGENYVVNRVVLAVPKDSKIKTFSDLVIGVKWIRCADFVPCGSAAKKALASENVPSSPVSLEPMSSTVLSKLLTGEVAAAIVYRTDVLAHPESLRSIEFRNSASAKTQYQIAMLRRSKESSRIFTYLKSAKVVQQLMNQGFDLK